MIGRQPRQPNSSHPKRCPVWVPPNRIVKPVANFPLKPVFYPEKIRLFREISCIIKDIFC
jgi:hypothetical protein